MDTSSQPSEEEDATLLVVPENASSHNAAAFKPVHSSSGPGRPSVLPHTTSTEDLHQHHQPRTKRDLRKFSLGVALLVIVAVIWVGASALTQYIFRDLHFQRPFFLTYVNTSEFVILLPFRYLWEKYFANGFRVPFFSSSSPSSPPGVWFATKKSDWKKAAKAALFVCPLWFLAQGAYNWSLAGTSVSSSTILSSTSCVFTLLLSVIFLKEKATLIQAIGVLATVVGAALTSYSDESSSADSSGSSGSGGSTPTTNVWWGDVLALFSAFMYAVYTTAIKRQLPDTDGERENGTSSSSSSSPSSTTTTIAPAMSTTVFFGFIGLYNCLTLWPGLLIFHAVKLEDLSSISPSFVALILVKGLFDNVLSDVLWAKAIQYTNATLATVALSLTIPLAMVSDLVLHNTLPSALTFAGSFAVLTGFMVTTLAAAKEEQSRGNAGDASNVGNDAREEEEREIG